MTRSANDLEITVQGGDNPRFEARVKSVEKLKLIAGLGSVVGLVSFGAGYGGTSTANTQLEQRLTQAEAKLTAETQAREASNEQTDRAVAALDVKVTAQLVTLQKSVDDLRDKASSKNEEQARAIGRIEGMLKTLTRGGSGD